MTFAPELYAAVQDRRIRRRATFAPQLTYRGERMEMDWTYDDSRGPVAGRLPAVNWRRLPSGVDSRAGSERRGQGVNGPGLQWPAGSTVRLLSRATRPRSSRAESA